jgi:hypothetical protein
VFVLAIFHLESDNETNKIVRWKMKELLKLVRSSAVHFEMERGEEKIVSITPDQLDFLDGHCRYRLGNLVRDSISRILSIIAVSY